MSSYIGCRRPDSNATMNETDTRGKRDLVDFVRMNLCMPPLSNITVEYCQSNVTVEYCQSAPPPSQRAAKLKIDKGGRHMVVLNIHTMKAPSIHLLFLLSCPNAIFMGSIFLL